MSAISDDDATFTPDVSSVFDTILRNDLEYLGERVIFTDTAEGRLQHWKAFEVSA